MISELIFVKQVPIPGVAHYARQDRFRADEGWYITAGIDGVRLSRSANGDEWKSVRQFVVVGVPYAFIDEEVPVAPAKPQPRKAQREPRA